MVNKQLWTINKSRCCSFEVIMKLLSPHCKLLSRYEILRRASDLTTFPAMEMDMRFETWNVRTLHRPGS